MLTSDLDYDLPESLIATSPAEPRDAARLMVVRRSHDNSIDASIEHRHVRDLPTLVRDEGLLHAGDLLVFNDTRVLPAAFEGVRSATGGRVRGLYLDSAESADGVQWRAMLESGGTLRVGETVALGEVAQLTLIESVGGGQWRVALAPNLPTLDVLQQVGSTPLPPYIRKQRRAQGEAEVTEYDAQRYNTVVAQSPGSVAAPTAALHFTEPLLAELDALGIRRATVTLHIGLGTFLPIRADVVEQHDIHSEWMTVPAATRKTLAETREAGGRIVPIGTTSVRALESLPAPSDSPDPTSPASHFDDFTTNTGLYITPDVNDGAGFDFRFADGLLTNFHLPRSTLLALVAALPGVGIGRLLGWYSRAIEHGYRFYSYGDAMLIM